MVIAVLVWGLSAPLAMAFSHCVTMGAMCEGPCGASSCVTSVARHAPSIGIVASAEPRTLDRIPQTSLEAPELPPK